MSGSESSNFEYQINTYFGVFYPIERVEEVLDIVKKNRRFAALAEDDGEVDIGGEKYLIISTNSDAANEATLGFIAVDEMTIGGPDYDDPVKLTVDLDPARMEKLEKENDSGVNAITDLYDSFVREFKKKKIPFDTLYHGWRAVSCTWATDDESSDETTTASESTEPVKKRKGKKDTPAPAPPVVTVPAPKKAGKKK